MHSNKKYIRNLSGFCGVRLPLGFFAVLLSLRFRICFLISLSPSPGRIVFTRRRFAMLFQNVFILWKLSHKIIIIIVTQFQLKNRDVFSPLCICPFDRLMLTAMNAVINKNSIFCFILSEKQKKKQLTTASRAIIVTRRFVPVLFVFPPATSTSKGSVRRCSRNSCFICDSFRFPFFCLSTISSLSVLMLFLGLFTAFGWHFYPVALLDITADSLVCPTVR